MYMKKILIIINCIFPVIIGTMIYLLFRSTSLLVFSWLDYLNLLDIIKNLRLLTVNLNNIPEWIIFSLPHALWSYSFMFSIYYVWKGENNRFKYLWVLLVLTISIGGELGQLIDVVPGTFDFIDLFFSIIASISPFLILKFGGMINVFKDDKT